MNEQLKWAADIFFLVLPFLSIIAIWVMYALSLLRKNKLLFRTQKEMELNLLAKIQFDFSHDFHDGVGSPLKVIKKEIIELTDQLKQMEHADSMIYSMKQISDEINSIQESILNIQEVMYPSELLNGHLFDALKHFQKIHSRNGFHIELTCPEFESNFQPYISLHVFRIIQETILNVKQHTNLNYIEINISCNDQYLEIEMVYLQNKEIQFSTVVDINSKSRGLLSLKNRIQMIDGRRTSQIKDGYHFEVIQLPLKLN
jgi:signal transduction histidine kinase